MVSLMSLWPPSWCRRSVCSSSASSHTVLPYHRSDVLKLSGAKEDGDSRCAAAHPACPPGDYAAPRAGSPRRHERSGVHCQGEERPAGVHDDRARARHPRWDRTRRWFIMPPRGRRLRWRHSPDWCWDRVRASWSIFARRQHGCLHGVRAGIAAAFDLVPAELGSNAEIGVRRPDLRPGDGRGLRVAVAQMS